MNQKTVKIIHWTAIGLIALTLILQFLPYWSTPEGSVSIGSYLWFPSQNPVLTEQFQAQIRNDFALRDVDVVMPLLQFVFGLISIICCKKRGIATAICMMIAGLAGIFLPFISPIYMLGSTWVIFLLVGIALTALSVILLVSAIRNHYPKG